MKAIVYKGIKKVDVENVEDPKIEKDDDIIVKVTSTAICGSDLHLIHGMVPNMPHGFRLGHETMGIIEEVGKDVVNLKKNDRVIVPFPIACGHCCQCEHGNFSQCDNSNPNGEAGAIFGYSNTYGGYPGGQAEYLRVPYANVGPRIIPEGLEDEQVLFLTDVLPTSYWGVEMGNIKLNDVVVVLGCGPIGLTAIKWAIRKGAKRIIAVDNVDYRLKHASKYGGVETINFEDYDNTGEYIKEITHGGADVVLEVAGAEATFRLAWECARPNAIVTVVALYDKAQILPLPDMYGKNLTFKTGGVDGCHCEETLKLIAEGRLDTEPLLTHTYPLCRIEEAYELFENKRDGVIKVAVEC